MERKKIAILGAGISGLATGFFLKRHAPSFDVTLFEKDAVVGGVIQSKKEDGIFFEHGPRTFSTTRTPKLLHLIQEMNLQDALHFSHARTRYILKENNVEPLPDHPLRLLLSPFRKGVLSAAYKDLNHPAGLYPDETIERFILRHGNRDILENIIDPMVIGIFAGDYAKLSVDACLPKWKHLEYKYGSLIKGLYKTRKKSSLPPLYTLNGGMHTLADALFSSLSLDARFETPVETIAEREDHVRINNEAFDHAFVCLPSNVLTEKVPEKYRPFFAGIEHKTLSVVNVAYHYADVPKDGFGYLAPTKERADILGVVFDSSVFPQLHEKDVTRLTVMLHGSERLEERAFSALKHHLKIDKTPLQVRTHTYAEYLPQLLVGHLARRDLLQGERLSFVGNYLHSVSVEACVTEAEKAVISMLRRQKVVQPLEGIH